MSSINKLNRLQPAEIEAWLTELFNEGLLDDLFDETKDRTLTSVSAEFEYFLGSERRPSDNPYARNCLGATLRFVDANDHKEKLTFDQEGLIAVLHLDDEDDDTVSLVDEDA